MSVHRYNRDIPRGWRSRRESVSQSSRKLSISGVSSLKRALKLAEIREGGVSVNTPIARYRGPSYPSRARPVIGNVGVVSCYKIIRKVVVAAGTEDGPCRMRSGWVKDATGTGKGVR